MVAQSIHSHTHSSNLLKSLKSLSFQLLPQVTSVWHLWCGNVREVPRAAKFAKQGRGREHSSLEPKVTAVRFAGAWVTALNHESVNT